MTARLLTGLEAVLQTDGAVEDQGTGLGVSGIGAEVTHTQELEAVSSLCLGQRGLYLGLLQNLQRAGIQAVQEVLIAALLHRMKRN